MSGGVSRSALRNLLDDHREKGSIPLEKVEDLLRIPEPYQIESEENLYVLREYDGFDHSWIDVTKPLPWDETLEQWKKETDNGLHHACFDDLSYYHIYPARTRMMFSGG